MATYAALLYSTQDYDWAAPELAEVMGEYSAFGQAAAQVITGGAALQPTTTATTVMVTGGKGGDVVIEDGGHRLGGADPRRVGVQGRAVPRQPHA